MATIKTNRDFLTLVSNGTINDEVKAFAKEQIAKLDEKNEKRKVSKSALAHKSENDGFKNAILAALADGKVWVAATLQAIVCPVRISQHFSTLKRRRGPGRVRWR